MSIKIALKGQALLKNPLLNKDTAFSAQERESFELLGLLPCNTETIEEQLQRCREAFDAKPTPMEQHIYLRALQDRNEVLFYRFIVEHLEEFMPIIYTPVVGDACQYFHHIYRQPRGLFISYPERDKMDSILANIASTRDVRVIVVTDGERILGLGDQGVGGLGIPIGKLSLYTACGGINPAQTLPVILDVGTNNEDRLQDKEYLGWRHNRLSGEDYYQFVDHFVTRVKTHFPNALLQFEDFAQTHAYPLLEKYQHELCTFNDDIQGTAAVAVAAVIAATKVVGKPLCEQRVAILGAGSAGCGIAEQLVQAMINQGLSENDARARFYLVDRFGLLHDEMSELLPFQTPFAHAYKNIAHWSANKTHLISLMDVMKQGMPTILLGVSGQPGLFDEALIRQMAKHCERPIVFPLSNPTSRAEATPQALLSWTSGRALVATGSPFAPVTIEKNTIPIAQCNNAYIFPGVGLAVVAGAIQRVTDSMMMAAAIALSELAPAVKTGQGRLLPELTSIRDVSRHIAKAVLLQAIKEGHAKDLNEEEIHHKINESMWYPKYHPLIPR